MSGDNTVTISSTTNTQSEIDTAVNHDLETGQGETPPPSRATTTVTSSTDVETPADNAELNL